MGATGHRARLEIGMAVRREGAIEARVGREWRADDATLPGPDERKRPDDAERPQDVLDALPVEAVLGGDAGIGRCSGGALSKAMEAAPWCTCCSDEWAQYDRRLDELYANSYNGGCRTDFNDKVSELSLIHI